MISLMAIFAKDIGTLYTLDLTFSRVVRQYTSPTTRLRAEYSTSYYRVSDLKMVFLISYLFSLIT